jgi:hypothetical protein
VKCNKSVDLTHLNALLPAHSQNLDAGGEKVYATVKTIFTFSSDVLTWMNMIELFGTL